jgi:DHA1 family multidrug resistance protein-like MFS transporter
LTSSENGKPRNPYIPFWVLNRDLTLLFACNLMGAFGDGLYSYLLPIYLSDSLGANSVQVGILYAIVSLLAASSLLVAGMLADKYDRKKIMIAGWIAWIPAPLIFAVATNWMQAIPGMILWGIWLGGPTTTAYIVATADKNKLTLTFTMISAAWSIGYIFSPAIGGYLTAVSGMHYVFYLAAVFYCLACGALFFIRSQHGTGYAQRSLEEKASFFKLLRGRKLLTLTVFFASTMFILMMYRPFVVKFLERVYGYGEFEIGVLGSVLFFGSAVLGILLGRLGDRRRKSYAFAVSMFLGSISLLLAVRFGNFPVLLVAFFLAGGSYIIWSLMGAIIGPLAPERIRARWVSVPQTVSMFSSFIAPYIGGLLYDASPYYPLFIAIVAMAIIALLAFTKLLEE